MLLLLQLALGIAFLGYLVLAFFDLICGMSYILTGMGLLVIGLTLKGVSIVLKKIHPIRHLGQCQGRAQRRGRGRRGG